MTYFGKDQLVRVKQDMHTDDPELKRTRGHYYHVADFVLPESDANVFLLRRLHGEVVTDQNGHPNWFGEDELETVPMAVSYEVLQYSEQTHSEQLRAKDAAYVWMSDMYRDALGELGVALGMKGKFSEDYGTNAMIEKIKTLTTAKQ